jgi:hypothetical protein
MEAVRSFEKQEEDETTTTTTTISTILGITTQAVYL